MLVGPQEPRLACWPDAYTTAAADELCDFSDGELGQPMDPWQRTSLEINSGEQRDGTWAALEASVFVQRQNGKGSILEARGLGGLFVFGERRMCYTAHNMDTVQGTFGRFIDLVDANRSLWRRVKRINKVNGEEAIELIGGAELHFRTRGKIGGKGRGRTYEILFLDEALYLPQHAADSYLPTMLAMSNPQIWYTSTPPLDARAYIMQIMASAEKGAPNLGCAAWFNDRGADLEDPKVMAYGNPAYGIRLNARLLATLRERLGEAGYARECGGIWPEPIPDRWQLIDESLWLVLGVPRASMDDPVALGVWVNHDRDRAAIGAAGARSNGPGRLVELTGSHAGGLDVRDGVDWLAPRVAELERRHSPLVIVTNDRVLADSNESIRLASSTDQSAAASMFVSDVKSSGLWHRGQAALTQSAAGAAKQETGKKWAWAEQAGVDVCPVGAASLALWGLSTPRVHRAKPVIPMAAYG